MMGSKSHKLRRHKAGRLKRVDIGFGCGVCMIGLVAQRFRETRMADGRLVAVTAMFAFAFCGSARAISPQQVAGIVAASPTTVLADPKTGCARLDALKNLTEMTAGLAPEASASDIPKAKEILQSKCPSVLAVQTMIAKLKHDLALVK